MTPGSSVPAPFMPNSIHIRRRPTYSIRSNEPGEAWISKSPQEGHECFQVNGIHCGTNGACPRANDGTRTATAGPRPRVVSSIEGHGMQK